MLAPAELKQIKIFSRLGERDLQWLSLQAGDPILKRVSI